MKKIAFISPGYSPLPAVKGGAVETLIDILINSEKVKQKYEIDVYSIFNKDAMEESRKNSDVSYYYIKSRSFLEKSVRYIINKNPLFYIGNGYINELLKVYSKKIKEYDYVIVENKPEFGLMLKKYVTGKMIFHSHNDFLNVNTKKARKIYDIYDEIYCLSKYICDRVKAIKKEENISKVKLLYNGVDVEKFNIDIDVEKERKKFNIKKEDSVFLYTGRLVKEKGIKELIEAFNKIKNNNYKLVIVGKINNKNKFQKEIKKMCNENNNIIFTGYIDYNEIPKIYNIANYGVVPSIWEEPFALTTIEHLASGHPVIVTDSGAITELVNNSCSIIIQKNKDVVSNLEKAILKIDDKDFDFENCIKQAKKFDSEKYINTFMELVD